MVEVMKKMVTTFKRSYGYTATLIATDPATGHCQPTTPAEVWVSGACCWVEGSKCSSSFMRSFEGGHHYLHYLHHSLVSGQATGREHNPSH